MSTHFTGDGFDDTVGHFRDLLIHRNTQHLNGDPVELSGTRAGRHPSDGLVLGGPGYPLLLRVLT